MKKLLVMRHAKSSWADASLADHDRPLNKRGKRDAPRMGVWLVEQNLEPQTTLASTAKRALATAELVTEPFSTEHQLLTDRRLYHARSRDYQDVLSECLDHQSCVLVVSHNPGSEEWIYEMTGEYITMPTAAIAVVQLASDIPWNQISRRGAKAEVLDVWRPKEIF